MSFYAYVKQPDDGKNIWHYMDFARFMLLVDQRTLFFEQVEKIDYQFEGYGTIGHVVPGANVHDPAQAPLEAELLGPCRSCLVLSRWHMHEHESAAMWREYEKDLAHIAICSDVDRLKKGLNYSLLKYVKIGRVNYEKPMIDDTGASIEVDYFYKRQSFAYQHEIRVLAQARDLEVVTRSGGLLVPADVGVLVSKIHVSPKVPAWFTDLVRSIVTDKYRTSIEVVQSGLLREALT